MKNQISVIRHVVTRSVSTLLMICALAYTSASVSAQETHLAEDSAQAWMLKMANAVSGLNYQISFVQLKSGGESHPYLWRHGVNEEGVTMEQISLLNGPGKEILRLGNQVSYFEPNVPPYSLRSSLINGPLPSTLLTQPTSLTDAYDFVLVGRSRISGRAAQQIRIVSKDKNRFGYNLWLDQETGLPLKLNMVDMKGLLLEQIQVTALQVTEQPHVYFSRIESAKLPQVLDFRQPTNNAERWQVAYIPAGMEIVKRDTHRLPFTGAQVDYLMLSDGLVDVSVYLQPTSSQTSQKDMLWRVESNTFITRQQGPFSVTVIGKLPPQTANAIASSVTMVTP